MDELHCLLDTPTLRVSYDTANKWLYNQWQGMHDPESVRRASLRIFDCLAQQPCAKMLSDHSLVQGHWPAVTTPAMQQNLQLLGTYGIAYFAWVPSLDYDNRLSMEQVLRQTSTPIAGIFDEVASAYDWLLHCSAFHVQQVVSKRAEN